MAIQVGTLQLGSDDFYPKTSKELVAGLYPEVASSQPAGGMLPNFVYELGTLSSATTFTMAAATDAGLANIWHWVFSTGSTAPNITWPAAILGWYGGNEPLIKANCRYEISVMDGYAICMEIALE